MSFRSFHNLAKELRRDFLNSSMHGFGTVYMLLLLLLSCLTHENTYWVSGQECKINCRNVGLGSRNIYTNYEDKLEKILPFRPPGVVGTSPPRHRCRSPRRPRCRGGPGPGPSARTLPLPPGGSPPPPRCQSETRNPGGRARRSPWCLPCCSGVQTGPQRRFPWRPNKG